MESLWTLFLLLWFKWKGLETRTENLSSPIIVYGGVNGCSLSKCFWQSKAKHYFASGTKVLNSILKVFNTGMQFLRDNKRSTYKKQVLCFWHISSQSEFCSFSDSFLEIQMKIIHVIFIQDADSLYCCFLSGFHSPFSKKDFKEMNRLLVTGRGWFTASQEITSLIKWYQPERVSQPSIEISSHEGTTRCTERNIYFTF